jgi:hypothetical protein
MSEQKTHWKKFHNLDYLGSYSLEHGKDLIATIKSVNQEKVYNPSTNKKEDCLVLHFQENIKPMVVNSTNSKTIQKLYKTPYIEEWTGKKIQIFIDNIKAFGEVVEALRIRPRIPKQDKISTTCEGCKGKIEAFEKATTEQVALHTQKTYGKSLCSTCATKEKEKGKVDDVL